MNFGDYFIHAGSGRQRFKVPKCIYCSTNAQIGCADCGAPLCKKHGALEVDRWKCREHRKRILAGVTKGELVNENEK